MSSAFIRLCRGLGAAVLLLSTVCAAPSPSPAAAPAVSWCPLAVNVHALDAGRVGLTFTTPAAPGPVAGTLALYAGSTRYDVPFRALSIRDDQRFTAQTIVDPTAVMIVRLPDAQPVDAAVVTALDGRACHPAYQPWFASVQRTPTPAAIEEALRRARTVDARTRTRIVAPACAQPNAPPRLLQPVDLEVPSAQMPVQSARVVLLVTIDASGAVSRSRVIQSSGSDAADAIAVRDTSAARFSAGTFACEPDVSTYTFAFTFG